MSLSLLLGCAGYAVGGVLLARGGLTGWGCLCGAAAVLLGAGLVCRLSTGGGADARGVADPRGGAGRPGPGVRVGGVTMRRRVYIAGPIGMGDLAANVNRATDAFAELAAVRPGYRRAADQSRPAAGEPRG